MKKFEVFQLEDSSLNKLKGGAVAGGTTSTNCATSFTQETNQDKDSNAKCESAKAELQSFT